MQVQYYVCGSTNAGRPLLSAPPDPRPSRIAPLPLIEAFARLPEVRDPVTNTLLAFVYVGVLPDCEDAVPLTPPKPTVIGFAIQIDGPLGEHTLYTVELTRDALDDVGMNAKIHARLAALIRYVCNLLREESPATEQVRALEEWLTASMSQSTMDAPQRASHG